MASGLHLTNGRGLPGSFCWLEVKQRKQSGLPEGDEFQQGQCFGCVLQETIHVSITLRSLILLQDFVLNSHKCLQMEYCCANLASCTRCSSHFERDVLVSDKYLFACPASAGLILSSREDLKVTGAGKIAMREEGRTANWICRSTSCGSHVTTFRK